MRAYWCLLRLYPPHIRAIYGAEMRASFESRRVSARLKGRLAVARLFLVELCQMLPDAASERIGMWSSHPSFRGQRPSDLSIVRPPNVGKREWFYRETEDRDRGF
jgi:hypothetical protein